MLGEEAAQTQGVRGRIPLWHQQAQHPVLAQSADRQRRHDATIDSTGHRHDEPAPLELDGQTFERTANLGDFSLGIELQTRCRESAISCHGASIFSTLGVSDTTSSCDFITLPDWFLGSESNMTMRLGCR